jgi:hypothetical protein
MIPRRSLFEQGKTALFWIGVLAGSAIAAWQYFSMVSSP